MEDQERALKLATEAGHILLENGAEISRVEDTMQHIATVYGVEDENFFVLSNGIISSGKNFARAEHIPIKGMQLSRVVEVNQISRDLSAHPMSLDELEHRLQAVRMAKSKPWWEVILGTAFGVAAFCIIFGGSFLDAVATFVCGLLLGTFMTFVGSRMSRLMGNFTGGLVGGLLCIIAYHLFPNTLHLPNMIIGTIIALVPGVPFTNGMRDIANEAYIAGTTRLIDAFLAFLGIAFGVSVALVLHGGASGAILQLGSPETDAVTSHWAIQLASAFVGTVGFAVIFGVPRRYYLDSGLTGMLGWGMFLLTGSVFLGALAVGLVSYLQAWLRRCPVTVFLICGIIPLVPGGGIFWTAYHLVVNDVRLAATTGFMALKVTVAIAAAIFFAAALYNLVAKRKPQASIKNE